MNCIMKSTLDLPRSRNASSFRSRNESTAQYRRDPGLEFNQMLAEAFRSVERKEMIRFTDLDEFARYLDSD